MYSQFTFKREMRYTRKWEKKTERRRDPKERREERKTTTTGSVIQLNELLRSRLLLVSLFYPSWFFSTLVMSRVTHKTHGFLQIRVQLLTSWEEGDDPLMSPSPSHRTVCTSEWFKRQKRLPESREDEQMGRGKRNICQTWGAGVESKLWNDSCLHTCIPKQREGKYWLNCSTAKKLIPSDSKNWNKDLPPNNSSHPTPGCCTDWLKKTLPIEKPRGRNRNPCRD